MSKTVWLLEAEGPLYFTGNMKMTGHPTTTEDAKKAKHYNSRDEAESERLSQHSLTVHFRATEHSFEGRASDVDAEAVPESEPAQKGGKDGGKQGKGNKPQR